ncbi:CRISPR-associated autoregulator, DevR family [Caldalkalibacillus thermarum TA2.A1]|uniref:CRISPR-associated autoregulator, DevR family n=1 Tax=Caldalkalibacillus thermarum (strain TA2.A1) TaxID=986075 RepID=F5L3W0_CALTT|nr:type I-B CRISPR-associated protein Cas7/Cst2/DevR [Caldalkalibacillus thermarum]EGL83970.1 CRISPR-associated autoregulator, DevR family [Caldalkalibacillus thermarum TA2.A1]QZT34741.1 type I-B CRISPR-associated protein Cas7/Cst2/DevR [Caldalkalibacillus thermarum TA2.A1]
MGKALTLTVIFRGNSLNYGEGIANISELKKIHRGNGDVLTFASRQSIRYDIVRLGNEWFEWNLDTVDKSKGTVQFREDVTIADSVEMDLFGYLKTSQKSVKRPAVARLSHAISLEPYKSDLEFLNNMGLASRIDETPNLANIEQHDSFYTYTLTLDLDKVGVDGDIVLPNETRAERVQQLLDIIKLLNRHIRGRQESLAPLFVIGGVYDVANPFFLGRIELEKDTREWNLKIETLQSALETSFAQKVVGEETYIGYVQGIFGNEDQFSALVGDRAVSVEHFFETMKQKVVDYYGVAMA